MAAVGRAAKSSRYSKCGLWIHAKCPNMSTSTFKYFLERPATEWTCPLCSLPRLGDPHFLEDEEITTTEGNYANQLVQPNENEMNNAYLHSQENMACNNCGQQEFDLLLQERREYSNRIPMFRLNINSLQNELDELKLLNDKMKSQIIFSLRDKDRQVLPEQTVHLNVSKRQRERRLWDNSLFSF